jgi:DNA-binding transcriptional ArsR family regulator
MIENGLAIDLAIGRSSVRQRTLALLMAGPGSRLHLREIQRRVGTSPGTASRELARLVAAGLVDREAEGHQVYFRASTSPAATMLRSIIVALPAPPPRTRPRRLPAAAQETSPTAPEQRGRSGETPEARPSTDHADAGAFRLETPLAADDEAPDGGVADSGTGAGRSSEAEAASIEPTSATDIAPRMWNLGPSASASAADPVGLRIAGRLAESVREIYGASLRGVYLYGARAAGPAPLDAEVETVVVLDRVDRYGEELERTSQVCAALSREMNIVVSRIFVSGADWADAPDGSTAADRMGAVAV